MTPRSLVAHNGARELGGAERWLLRLLERLQERGHRVLLLCRDEGMAELARAAGVPADVGRLGGAASLHHVSRFAARLRQERPDALLLGTFKKTWLGGMAARRAHVPRVVARIGLETDLPTRGAHYRVAFDRWIDRVVVNAAGLRAPLLAGPPPLPQGRVVVIENGVDVPARALPPGELRRRLGIPEDAPVVGAIARLVPQKRLELLLAAVARTAGARAVIAGDGSERAALERRAAELGVADRVAFLGHREDVGDVLDALDLFAVTSRTEGMSNAMLEALAAGVPVLSTPVSGAREALERNASGRAPGWIVEPTEDAVAERLGWLLADRAALRAAGDVARERARQRFAWGPLLDRWESVLWGAGDGSAESAAP